MIELRERDQDQERLPAERLPPPGWRVADEQCKDGFNKWSYKPYNAVFERRMGGDQLPSCDLAILFDGEQFIPAHGTVVMADRVGSAVEAAEIAMNWHVGWSVGNGLLPKDVSLAAVDKGYLGKMIDKTDDYLIQDIGRGKKIAHPRFLIDQDVKVGQVTEIRYKDGQGIASGEVGNKGPGVGVDR